MFYYILIKNLYYIDSVTIIPIKTPITIYDVVTKCLSLKKYDIMYRFTYSCGGRRKDVAFGSNKGDCYIHKRINNWIV